MTPSHHAITVAGRKVSMLRAGPTGGTPVLLVHGGRAGLSPIASGSYLWSTALPYIAAGRPVVAIDLPGAGGSDLGAPELLTIQGLKEHLSGVIEALAFDKVHLVGHDIGGLVGLWLALSAPSKIASLAIVASAMTPPKGDGLDDIVFQAAPMPLWSRESQSWAFDRVSYANAHIDDALLQACVTAASGQPHKDAVTAMADEKVRLRDFGIPAMKGKMWAALRDKGVGVPTQFIWSSDDPQAPREGGYVMFKILAEKQYATYFHLINRAGSYAFREQPQEFAQVALSFHDGVDSKLAA